MTQFPKNDFTLQASAPSCTPTGRDCYAKAEATDFSCLVDCEGLYADVDYTNPTKTEKVKDRLVLESLKNAYNDYKGVNVKNKALVDKGSSYGIEYVPYHPLQVVEIYFDTATYDKVVNDVSVTFGDQISAIGGTMGLFAGFSILSAVEIVYFMLKFLYSLFSKARMRDQIEIKCLDISHSLDVHAQSLMKSFEINNFFTKTTNSTPRQEEEKEENIWGRRRFGHKGKRRTKKEKQENIWRRKIFLQCSHQRDSRFSRFFFSFSLKKGGERSR